MPTFRELLAGTGIDARLDEQYFPEGMGHLLGSNPFDPKRLDAPGGFDFGAENQLQFAQQRQDDRTALEQLQQTADPFSVLRARGDGFEAFEQADGTIGFARIGGFAKPGDAGIGSDSITIGDSDALNPRLPVRPVFSEAGAQEPDIENALLRRDQVEASQLGTRTGGDIGERETSTFVPRRVKNDLTEKLREMMASRDRAKSLLGGARQTFLKGGSVQDFLTQSEFAEVEREGKQKSETLKRLLDISKRRTDIAGKIPDADPSTVSVLQQELEFLDQSRRGILEGMSDRERDRFFPGVGEAPAEDPTQIQPGVPAEDAPITAAGLDLGQNLEVIAKGGRLSSSDIQRVIPAIQSLEPTNALQQLAKDELLAAISSQPKGASAAKIWTTFIDRFKDRFNTQTTDVVGTKVEKDIKQLLRGGVFGVAASMELFRSIFE